MKRKLATPKRHLRRDLIVIGSFLFIVAFIMTASRAYDRLMTEYDSLFSRTITDRSGEIIIREPNARGAFNRTGEIPSRLKELIVKKEDRMFYHHFGVNPWSMIRVTAQFARGHRYGGASTITQQLAKIILGNEDKRTLANKFWETVDAVILECFLTKDELLDMYIRVAYLGNGSVGFPEASMRYFGKPLTALSDNELVALIAALGSPGTRNPWSANEAYVRSLSRVLGIPYAPVQTIPKTKAVRDGDAAFELRTLHATCSEASCTSTIDQPLTAQLRKIARRVTAEGKESRATNAAIVVIELPSRKIRAIVGSPDPRSTDNGAQIDMAIAPRQAGSTVKPLIYAAGFARGLRPYSLVDDEEYRYDIATGFPLYPKNYDGTYRGRVTLEHALGNSLNVPAVKVLEYVGLDAFTDILTTQLGFRSHVPIETYQYGIALGGLETDLLTLTHMLSLFGTDGVIGPLTLWEKGGASDHVPPMSMATTTRVFAPDDVALVNAILSDRTIGVEQFGLRSNLSLFDGPVAVKTGTSRDYHDSWTVGWTPDFIVGVWVGNAENMAQREVSGSSGAGRIWHDATEILLQSPYNRRTPFDLGRITSTGDGDRVGYGLSGEEPERHRNLLLSDRLIRSPHDGDTLLLTAGMSVPLIAASPVRWSVNGVAIGEGARTELRPRAAGVYTITGSDETHKESITIRIVSDDRKIP